MPRHSMPRHAMPCTYHGDVDADSVLSGADTDVDADSDNDDVMTCQP